MTLILSRLLIIYYFLYLFPKVGVNVSSDDVLELLGCLVLGLHLVHQFHNVRWYLVNLRYDTGREPERETVQLVHSLSPGADSASAAVSAQVVRRAVLRATFSGVAGYMFPG